MFGAGGISPFQLLVVVVLGLIFFGGKGRVSSAMGDLAKGLRSFRQGLKDDPDAPPIVNKIEANVSPSRDDK
jgi:sec-independent protein translocase protein TatA